MRRTVQDIQQRPRKLELGEDGQAMLEFALTFPWVLIFALMVLQLSLCNMTQNVVDYAAYCAARSATVQVPRFDAIDLGFDTLAASVPGSLEPPIGGFPISPKRVRIQTAAAFPLTVVSPRLTDVLDWPGVGAVVGIARGLLDQLPAGAQGWVGGLDKFVYAYAAVSINEFVPNFGGGVSVSEGPSVENFGNVPVVDEQLGVLDRGDIYIFVDYIDYLEIPVANYMLSHVYLYEGRGNPSGFWSSDFWGAGANPATRNSAENMFITIRGFCRMPYEGQVANVDDEIPWLDPFDVFQ